MEDTAVLSSFDKYTTFSGRCRQGVHGLRRKRDSINELVDRFIGIEYEEVKNYAEYILWRL